MVIDSVLNILNLIDFAIFIMIFIPLSVLISFIVVEHPPFKSEWINLLVSIGISFLLTFVIIKVLL